MRLDLWLWLAGGLVVLTAGALRLALPRSARTQRIRLWGLWTPLALTLAGLLFLIVGLVWRSPARAFPPWSSVAWLGSTSADGVAMLSAGALAMLLWILFTERRLAKAGDEGLDRDRSAAEGLALLGASVLILLAIGAAWNSLPAPSPLERSWLQGVRAIAASLGLGAWFPAFADAVWGLRTGIRRPTPTPITFQPGPDAMRAGYPWLTAAWLLAAAGSLAAAAVLWRGLASEAWLMAAWLLGGVYLLATAGAGSARLPQWLLVFLTASGAVAALLQAWQTPMLLT